jgi:RNA polymerase-binding transcription factor DksA
VVTSHTRKYTTHWCEVFRKLGRENQAKQPTGGITEAGFPTESGEMTDEYTREVLRDLLVEAKRLVERIEATLQMLENECQS